MRNKAIIFGVIFITLAAGGYFFYKNECGPAIEIRAYAGAKSNVYLWGKSYCVETMSFRKVNKDTVKNLPRDVKAEIISKNEDESLENLLYENFLGYNKYTAGEGKDSFVIYETICKACELK